MSAGTTSREERSAKRSRTASACQNCRLRKLSCSGTRPCTRCDQDGRECIDVSLEERTPLTRKRMTELEDRIAEYERVWSVLFPQTSLSGISGLLASAGLHAAVDELRKGNPPWQPLLPRPPSAVKATPTFTSPQQSHTTPISLNDGTTYPPTRPPSPRAVPVRIALDLHGPSQDFSNAWNEDSTPVDRISGPPTGDTEFASTTAGNDFGTGMRAGVGYIGLSSAVTLLRAIQKFVPTEIQPSNHEPGLHTTTGSISINGSSHLLKADDENLILPSPNEIRPLVDSYFQYFHSLTPIVHEPTIRAQIMGALPLPTGRGSRVLFNMIFATGAFDSALDDTGGSNGIEYYERARAALQEDLLEGGSLMLVQGLGIMAIWLQRCNRPNAGYVCLGLAIRMATALGAHVSIPSDKPHGPSVLESEMRSRIWWCLVTLEAGQSLTYGRPHGISLPSLSTVRLPINIDDGLLTVSTTKTPLDVDHVTVYTALCIQARLAQMVFYSLDRVSRSLPSPSPEQIKWCGDRFRDQLAALPQCMQPRASGPYEFARAVQVWRARDCQSILYRPVLLSVAWNTGGSTVFDSTTQEIINTCRDLALDNLRDIAEFQRAYRDPRRGCEWYILYFGIQASLTLLLSIVCEPQNPAATTWRERIQETILWIRQLDSMKELGATYAQIMETILAAGSNTNVAPAPTMHPPAPVGSQQNDQSMPDFEALDFDRYLAEIWEGDVQIANTANEVNLSMLPNNWWDDMLTGG